MRLKVYPYKLASKSAKELARGLRVKRIIPNGKFKPNLNTTVINWGSSKAHFTSTRMLNQPNAVACAANKLTTFTKMKQAGVSVVEFTTSRTIAENWLMGGHKVVCRHLLSSHSGRGIEVTREGEHLPHAPLYTKYTKKNKEYRVHLFKGEVIDLIEKRKRAGVMDANPLIRNLDNGWVFCRDNVYASPEVSVQARKAIVALGLDFGAVDIIERNGKVWVLEVNCAPGLVGTTLQSYINAIRKLTRYE
jgi:glutathione synthase/RimK-type ligase-like ATP-grasp enzyme